MRILCLLLSIVALGCSPNPASIERKTDHRPQARYSVYLFEKNAEGEYKRRAGTGSYRDPIPCEAHPLDHLDKDIEVQIRGIGLSDRTATLGVICRGKEEIVEASNHGADAYFDNGALKITVKFDGSTLPPYTATDLRLYSPITAYKIHPNYDYDNKNKSPATHVRGFLIIESRSAIDEDVVTELRTELSKPENLTASGAMCFDPGLAFRVGEGDDASDLVICLECSWLRIYESNNDNEHLEYGLSKTGVRQLEKIYSRLFGKP